MVSGQTRVGEVASFFPRKPGSTSADELDSCLHMKLCALLSNGELHWRQGEEGRRLLECSSEAQRMLGVDQLGVDCTVPAGGCK